MEIVAKQCMSCGAGLPSAGLTCSFCGTAHVIVDNHLSLACAACGSGNKPDASFCVQCQAALASSCPECAAPNPFGARFCQECRIELRTFRDARVLRAPCLVEHDDVERWTLDWLRSRWFKARDLASHVRVIDQTLLWVPVWLFHTRATGTVQGETPRTHYRTIRSPTFDNDDGWSSNVDSVPYQVWYPVTKEFDESIGLARAATSDADRLAGLLGVSRASQEAAPNPGLAGLAQEAALVEETCATADWERAFEPDATDHEAFAALRAQAEQELRSRLIERIEMLKVRYLRPRLDLVLLPVWEVVYRYKRAHGDVRIAAATGVAQGKRMSLLNQWLG